ncbi:iron chelate uptake ABC transporter family permease subunit [Sulfitobacter donghicola]|uniref:Iron ABC transporter permease n=2 Tax=Sulfitobacter TaxID=60136 RepID=A0A073ISY3_9RHOB|nr:iron chelate uptake ABC transporter family permease subunit [Sulfitobacter donghicola]KEJ88497.1 iron ABC transporter permease [Sulfitobacter donghicola DSW-25 = KCTC 12864 = JCM 14565]
MLFRRLTILGAVLLCCVTAYLTLGSRGNWAFVLPFRGNKLAVLLLVSVAVSTATVLFQTITQNRILTPAIMGFDALYVLILTVLIFVLGAPEFQRLSAIGQFALNTSLMMVASLVLFGTLLRRNGSDLIRMLLTGIIFSVLFRSLTGFLQRMIDPNEYAVVQVSSYARFARVELVLLGIAAGITLLALIATWRMRYRLDVLALGAASAINLGENPKRAQFEVLVIVAVLVCVSTALVGPMAFLGLLVVSLAHLVTPTSNHSILLPSAALISAITLVGGQMVLERLLGLSTPLVVVIDVLGGLVFLFLLLRGRSK